jgi:hypothetical protein
MQSHWFKWRVSWRDLPWVVGWAGGLWGAWLFLRSGNLILGLLLLLLSLGLLWGSAGISILSALNRFCLNPSLPDTKVTHPLSWGCYLFGYNLFLAILSATFVAFPMGKHLGASSIAGMPRPWIWVLFAPVTEELLFRLPLRYNVINLTTSALLFTLLTVRRLLLKFGSSGWATATERWLWSAVFAILVGSVVFVLLRSEPVTRLAKNLWLNHFRSVLYASCFAFGLVHIFNFRFTALTAETLLLAPLLVLPQIISGFILAFTRLHLGMIWCIALHAANNFLVVVWVTIGPVRPRPSGTILLFEAIRNCFG